MEFWDKIKKRLAKISCKINFSKLRVIKQKKKETKKKNKNEWKI